MRAYIVVTTINIPTLLEGYAKNLQQHGHADKVGFIVIPDKKTPPEAKKVTDKLTAQGFEAHYMNLPEQETYLDQFPKFKPFVPYNTDNRRNVGFLFALEKGAEILLSIDDDNYVTDDDFFGWHSVVGKTVTMPAVSSSTQWFNICGMMQKQPDREIFPRGFPYSKRFVPTEITTKQEEGKVMMNAGLWLEEPDVDAVTRLAEPVKTTKVTSPPLMLARHTFSPINTQNTAIRREVLPAYYYVLMQEKIHGSVLERFGDIWSGFFAKKCIDAMDHRVTVGKPVCNHIRNQHNLFKDLQHELWGMLITETVAKLLEEMELPGTSYSDAYLALKEQLLAGVKKEPKFSPEVQRYFEKLGKAMEAWVEVCEKIG